MKATLKNINKYLSTLTPHFELVKGNGYFYFGHHSVCGIKSKGWDYPKSIHVCHLNHMTLEEWETHIKAAVKEWVEDLGEVWV